MAGENLRGVPVDLGGAFKDLPCVTHKVVFARCSFVLSGAAVVEGDDVESGKGIDLGEELGCIFVGFGKVEHDGGVLVPEAESVQHDTVFQGAGEWLCLVLNGFVRFFVVNGARKGVPAFRKGKVEDHAYIDDEYDP